MYGLVGYSMHIHSYQLGHSYRICIIQHGDIIRYIWIRLIVRGIWE